MKRQKCTSLLGLLLAPLVALLLLPAGAAAAENPLVLYQDARFELLQIGTAPSISPDSLCDALLNANPKLGKPRCSIAGSLQRDTLFSRYSEWVGRNLRPGVDPEDLSARHPHTKEVLRKLRDDYLLLLKSDSTGDWVALYHNGSPYPLRLKRLSSPAALLPATAALFKGNTVPIPTEKERESARIEPDQFFRDQLPLDFILTVGGGAMQGIWGHDRAQIEEYTKNSDSCSAWDWIEPRSPLFFVEYGVSYARFASIAGYFQWSHHDVKYNQASNPAIEKWSLLRWEFGVRTRLGYTFFPLSKIELHPYFGLAFHFTAYQEFLEWKKGVARPEERFHLVALTGASVGAGVQLLYDARWGVRIEGGLARRSRRSRDVEPGGSRPPDRPGEESYELYSTIGLLWNWRSFL